MLNIEMSNTLDYVRCSTGKTRQEGQQGENPEPSPTAGVSQPCLPVGAPVPRLHACIRGEDMALEPGLWLPKQPEL